MSKQTKRQAAQRRAAQKRARRNHDRAASPKHELSPAAERKPWQWRELPADKRALLERFDGLSSLRSGLSRVAAMRGEWAGLPMPLDGGRLVIDQSYPYAKKLMEAEATVEIDDGYAGAIIRNRFWSWRWRSEIVIFENSGKLDWGKYPGANHFGLDVKTLGCSDAWGLEQEQKALQLLGTLISHRALKQYILTGMFLETSKRSGVSYMFRRLKPTVAISSRTGELRILCALCLHPIAYYSGSWAGAMCPTDDVVAHLMLMRGDEPMYWRRAQQHAPYRSEAGL
jgi:hypothetical protein